MKFKPLYNPTQLTCQITIGDWPACEGVQKLIGFGRGLGFHKVDYFPYWHISNSIVLGCNRSENEDTVRLWAYGYVKGEHFQEKLGNHKIGENIFTDLRWNEYLCMAAVYYRTETYRQFKNIGFNTLPIGFLLNPYAEIDGKENKQIPFEVEIKDLKVNGKMIKIK
jgi:hypothetical protein